MTKATQGAAQSAVISEPSVYTFFEQWLKNTLEIVRIAVLRWSTPPHQAVDYSKTFGPDGITYHKLTRWLNGPGSWQIHAIMESEFKKTLANFIKTHGKVEYVKEFFTDKENALSLYDKMHELIIKALHIKVYFKGTLDKRAINNIIRRALNKKLPENFYLLCHYNCNKPLVLDECAKALDQTLKTINRIVGRVVEMAKDPDSRNFREAFKKIKLEFPEIPDHAIIKTDYELNKLYNLIKYRYIDESKFGETIAVAQRKLFDLFGDDLLRLEMHSRGILKAAEGARETHAEHFRAYEKGQKMKKPSYAPKLPEESARAAKTREKLVGKSAKVKIPKFKNPVKFDIRIPKWLLQLFK